MEALTPFDRRRADLAAKLSCDPWTPDALRILDELWGTDATMETIQTTLAKATGVRFRGEDIRIAASRPKSKPTTNAPIAAKEPVTIAFVPRDHKDRVKKVAPGTYRTKPFSMLGGRL